ncbi:hypothetical protein [Priestia megaterium]|uniref:Uncharacterized protein n=1 Tax=Priestia megaterium TaxID=1404 RepID=A0A6M6DNP7_PRIMG|nr:hypothetical protein [Priestia megaterium]QJX74724.1 hypothetical protein FDZ14_00460 [Priestia megaterium]
MSTDYLKKFLKDVKESDFNGEEEANKEASNEASKNASNTGQGVQTTAMGTSNVIDKVINSKTNSKNKDKKPVFKGIYFEPDIYDVITQIIDNSSKKNIQSSIVNDCLREVFKDRGLL